jgi:hypothetical protein
MNIPKLSGVADLVALQNAIALLLCDDTRLANVPIVPEIKFHEESDLQTDILWTMPRRNVTVSPTGVTISTVTGQPGPTGAGLMIEMPTANTQSTNVTGPPTDWEIGVVAFEERNTNLIPSNGIGIMSEQLVQIVKDILHLQNLGTFAASPWGFGTLRAKRLWMSPAHDWMQTLGPGIIAWRASFESTSGVKQSPRSAPVQITFSSGNCVLTCADNSAAVYYTTDGSLPVQVNANATLYSAPFAVSSGTQVLAASKRAGYISSEIWGNTAP